MSEDTLLCHNKGCGQKFTISSNNDGKIKINIFCLPITINEVRMLKAIIILHLFMFDYTSEHFL